jgi:hypothetical protein
METANPFAALRNTLPLAVTPGSKTVTSHALIAASASVQGTTKYFCATGVSSKPNSTASIATKVMKKRSTARFYRIGTPAPDPRRVGQPVPVARRASGGFAAK